MRLSVITINRNNAVGLHKTMESVLGQTYSDFEYIVIDGASTDGSVEVLGSLLTPLKGDDNWRGRIRWISEPDTGIYNAMNKGIRMATGEYLLFLNSGDRLIDDSVIESVVYEISGESVICGNIQIHYNGEDIVKHPPDVLTMRYLYNNALFHSGGSLIKKEMFVRYGLYDEKLKIVADWKFFIQILILSNESYKHVDVTMSEFDLNGISTQDRQLDNFERKKVLDELLPMRIIDDYEQMLHPIKSIDDYSGRELLWYAWRKLKMKL